MDRRRQRSGERRWRFIGPPRVLVESQQRHAGDDDEQRPERALPPRWRLHADRRVRGAGAKPPRAPRSIIGRGLREGGVARGTGHRHCERRPRVVGRGHRQDRGTGARHVGQDALELVDERVHRRKARGDALLHRAREGAAQRGRKLGGERGERPQRADEAALRRDGDLRRVTALGREGLREPEVEHHDASGLAHDRRSRPHRTRGRSSDDRARQRREPPAGSGGARSRHRSRSSGRP